MASSLRDVDDSSADALWRMYAKAKASLPYKERMQNLTWRMMGMKLPQQNGLLESDASVDARTDTVFEEPFMAAEAGFESIEQPLHSSSLGDEYLNFADLGKPLMDRPKVTSNLTKFFKEQQDKDTQQNNDPTSDDFDYVAHIKKIGQEEPHQQVPPEPHLFTPGTEIPFPSGSANTHSFHSEGVHQHHHHQSVSSLSNNNQFGSYMDSPGHDPNSFIDPLNSIASSYETPNGLNHSSSITETPTFFQSMYSQSLNTPSSSATQTPNVENGFFDSYFGSNRNSMSFANQMRSVPSMTSFGGHTTDANKVKMENDDIVMSDASPMQSQLSSSMGKRNSTSSTIKKKAVGAKLAKLKRNSSSTQLTSTSVPASQKKNDVSTNANTRCTNCNTQTTPLWRRNPEGQPLCNACGLFLKLHGVVRPLSLKTDVIKKRQRGMSTVQKKDSSPPSPNKAEFPRKNSSASAPKKTVTRKKQTPGGTPMSSSHTPNGGFDLDMEIRDTGAGTMQTPDNFGFHEQGGFHFGSSVELERQHSTNNTQTPPGDGAANNNWEWLTMAL